MSFASRRLNAARAGVRAMLRKSLNQERRTELKRLQGVVRKRLAPVLSLVHGSFSTEDLVSELAKRLPSDFEILMIHGSYDGLLPMYKGTATQLLSALVSFVGPERTLVMPSFVMGGRDFDRQAYFKKKPFDVRHTPSEMGLLAEVFRRTQGVLRSVHPTCSVCALGPLAAELTTGHHLAKAGLGPDSPFGVMTRRRTTILGLGVEYYRCLTHAHTATYELGEEFPVKFVKSSITVTLIDYDGTRIEHELGLPDRSKKLDLRVLLSVLSKEELVEWRFHGVPMFMVPQARIVTERLVEAARRGVTIYGRAPVGDASAGTAQRALMGSDR